MKSFTTFVSTKQKHMTIHLNIPQEYTYRSFYYAKVMGLCELVSAIKVLTPNPVSIELVGRSVVVSCAGSFSILQFMELISRGIEYNLQILSPLMDVTEDESGTVTYLISGLDQYIEDIYQYVQYELTQNEQR